MELNDTTLPSADLHTYAHPYALKVNHKREDCSTRSARGQAYLTHTRTHISHKVTHTTEPQQTCEPVDPELTRINTERVARGYAPIDHIPTRTFQQAGYIGNGRTSSRYSKPTGDTNGITNHASENWR